MSAKVHLLLFVIFIGILAFNSGLKTNNATSLKSSRAKASVGNLDSLKILERLTGEWAWDSSCYNQNKTTCYSSIHYRVVFFRNFKLKVFQHDSTIQTSNWIIQKEGNDFILSTNPCVDYVSGVVLINHCLLRMKD